MRTLVLPARQNTSKAHRSCGVWKGSRSEQGETLKRSGCRRDLCYANESPSRPAIGALSCVLESYALSSPPDSFGVVLIVDVEEFYPPRTELQQAESGAIYATKEWRRVVPQRR